MAIENVPAVGKVCRRVPAAAAPATRAVLAPFAMPVRVTVPLTGGAEASPAGGLTLTVKVACCPAVTCAGGITVIWGTAFDIVQIVPALTGRKFASPP